MSLTAFLPAPPTAISVLNRSNRETKPSDPVNSASAASFRQQVTAAAHTVVVKVGTRVLAQPDGTLNHKRIGRLMREHGLGSRKRRPFRVVTTDSRHDHPIAPNVLERDFGATAPNQKWLADLTYVRTDEGWLYLALVVDLFARKIVGWATSGSMQQELTIEALRVALGWRDPDAGLVHHSDRGSQYAAGDYRKVLQARGITVSMSRKGDCWDNAPMESLNGTLKVECVHGEHFRTRAQARQAIIDYIGYYNTDRRHSSLGYLPPALFERRWRAQTENSAQEPLQ